MKTSKHVEQCTQLTNSSPAPTCGFFITCTSLKKTRAGLTKVNKQVVKYSFSELCKQAILLLVKPAFSVVNNLSGLWYPTSWLFIALAQLVPLRRDYRISTLIYANRPQQNFLPSPRILKEKQ